MVTGIWPSVQYSSALMRAELLMMTLTRAVPTEWRNIRVSMNITIVIFTITKHEFAGIMRVDHAPMSGDCWDFHNIKYANELFAKTNSDYEDF